jgi:hypothetical protein
MRGTHIHINLTFSSPNTIDTFPIWRLLKIEHETFMDFDLFLLWVGAEDGSIIINKSLDLLSQHMSQFSERGCQSNREKWVGK